MSCCGPHVASESSADKAGGCCTPNDKGGACCGMMAKLKCCGNVGVVDRVFRTAVGSVLATLAATGDVGVWGWAGILLILSGLVGWCGGYTVLGINTRKKCCSGGSCSTEGDKAGCCK